jgi:hypothetical protein
MSNLSATSRQEKVTFKERTNMLNWIFIELAHWNNSMQVDMLIISDTLTWFHGNQSVLLFLKTVWEEATNTNCIVWYDKQSTALEVSILTITPPMQFSIVYTVKFHCLELWQVSNRFNMINYTSWSIILLSMKAFGPTSS